LPKVVRDEGGIACTSKTVGQLQAIGLRYRLTRRGLNPSLLLQFNEPQDDIAVALARPAHGREDGRGGPPLRRPLRRSPPRRRIHRDGSHSRDKVASGELYPLVGFIVTNMSVSTTRPVKGAR
jgi:hypothetical protein